MQPRIITRIEITPRAKEAVEVMSDLHGMTQVAMLSRIIEWVTAQPLDLQTIILKRWSEGAQPEIARLILRRLSKGKSIEQKNADALASFKAVTTAARKIGL